MAEEQASHLGRIFSKLRSPAFLALIDQVIVSGGNFFCVVFIGRLLGESSLGVYGYSFGVAIFLTMVTQVFFGQYLLLKRADGSLQGDQGNLHVLVFINFIISLVVFLCVYFGFRTILDVSDMTCALLAFFPVTQGFQDFYRKLAYYDDTYVAPFKNSVVVYGVRVAALVVLMPSSLNQVLMVLIGSSLIIFLMEFGAFIKSFAVCSRAPSVVRELVSESKYLLINLPVQWGWGQSPIYMIGFVLGAKYSGVFLAVRSLVKIFNIMLEMVPTYVGRYLADRLNKSEEDYLRGIKNVLFLGFIVWFPFMVVFYIYGEQALKIVFGDAYIGNGRFLALLWLYNLVNFLVSVVGVTKRIRKETASIMFSHCVALAVLLLSGYVLLTASMDIEMMGISMVISGLVLYSALKLTYRDEERLPTRG